MQNAIVIILYYILYNSSHIIIVIMVHGSWCTKHALIASFHQERYPHACMHAQCMIMTNALLHRGQLGKSRTFDSRPTLLIDCCPQVGPHAWNSNILSTLSRRRYDGPSRDHPDRLLWRVALSSLTQCIKQTVLVTYSEKDKYMSRCPNS